MFSMSKLRRRRLVKFTAFYMVLLAIIAVGFMAGYRINTTASYPMGFYKLTYSVESLKPGDMVAFCPRKVGFFVEASERDYLRKGRCKSGLNPLVKRIVGKPGDKITVDEAISVNGIVQANSALIEKDAEGRLLPRASSQIVQDGQFFVLSEHHAKSFDSRYFGTIPSDWIFARARPIWVVKN